MSAPVPIHLRPSAELADRVLLPGDPHRALAVAQSLLEAPRMFNHARGLWGYTGLAPDGVALTVQSTGMGGPSAAIVVEELIELGARTFIRIGTCAALTAAHELGQLLVAREVLVADGTSAALGAGPRLWPNARLAGGLEHAGATPATTVSTDLFYDPRDGIDTQWRAGGVEAVEMEAATLLAIAERRGTEAAVLLAVSDVLDGTARRRIDADALESAGVRMGELAFAALTAVRAPD